MNAENQTDSLPPKRIWITLSIFPLLYIIGRLKQIIESQVPSIKGSFLGYVFFLFLVLGLLIIFVLSAFIPHFLDKKMRAVPSRTPMRSWVKPVITAMVFLLAYIYLDRLPLQSWIKSLISVLLLIVGISVGAKARQDWLENFNQSYSKEQVDYYQFRQASYKWPCLIIWAAAIAIAFL